MLICLDGKDWLARWICGNTCLGLGYIYPRKLYIRSLNSSVQKAGKKKKKKKKKNPGEKETQVRKKKEKKETANKPR